MTVTLASSSFVAPRAARLPPRARAARRASASQVRHRVSASAGDDAQAPASVSRRAAVGVPATSALAALAASAASAAPARARGLPELACDGELVTAPSGLQYCDAVVGSGKAPAARTTIKAHYTGRLTDGRVFDSSYSRGSPLQFKVGAGQVIKGWDDGILGTEGVPPMRVGGKRILVIPANLGYGDRGAGGGLIPGGATLKFDVELVDAP
jgi:peptidylprolyl isomerase